MSSCEPSTSKSEIDFLVPIHCPQSKVLPNCAILISTVGRRLSSKLSMDFSNRYLVKDVIDLKNTVY